MRLNLKNGFSAHADIEDLEKLGWDFSDLYEGVALAQDLSIESAEVWEKNNYHIRFFNKGKSLRWVVSHNQHGDTGDSLLVPDELVESIKKLFKKSLLWEVFNGEDVVVTGDNVDSYFDLAIKASKMWKKRGFEIDCIEIADVNGHVSFRSIGNRGEVNSVIELAGKRLKFCW